MYGSKRWKRLRRAILRRDRYRCQSCLKLAGRAEIDHIKPVKDGGDFWDADNLQTLCRPCHFKKTASENTTRHAESIPEPVKEWRGMVDELIE